MKTESHSLPRQRPEIDGLRAIAILPVVLFHLGWFAPSGFVGVDVFFTISGFLISGIIFRELDCGNFSFARFWERRVRRIAPVFLFFTAATIFAGWLILHPRDFAQLNEQVTCALAGVANLKMHSLSGGYWAPQSESIPMLHTWSLAVEEQFYLFMPFLLWGLHRWLRQGIGAALVLMFVTSLLLSLALGKSHPEFNFYLLPTRAWELLLGCLGAYALNQGWKLPRSLLILATPLGLAMILYSVFISRSNSVWPNAWTLLPTTGTLLILISPGPFSDDRDLLVNRVLSAPPIRFVGLISYSLYLWHWPVIVFFKELKPDAINAVDRGIMFIGTLILATLSWRYVERPFRNHPNSDKVATKPLFLGAGVIWVGLIIASIWLSIYTRVDELAFEAKLPPHIARMLFHQPGLDLIERYDAGPRLKTGGVPINLGGRNPRCVVLGSSHGQCLGPLFEKLASAYDVPCVMMTQSGVCGIFAFSNSYVTAWRGGNAAKLERDEIVKKFISQWKPEIVVIAGKWGQEITTAWGPTPEESVANFRHAFEQTIAWLESRSIHVVIIGQVPQLPLEAGQPNAIGIWKRFRQNKSALPQFREPFKACEQRKLSKSLFRAYDDKLQFIDPEELFSNPDSSVRYYNNSGLLYYDDNHLSRLGVIELTPLVEPLFIKLRLTSNDRTGL